MELSPSLLRRSFCALVALLASMPAAARADDAAPPPGPATDRDAFLPFPTVGGNSDVGLEVGVAASYVRFRHGIIPHALRLDGVLSTSIKSDDRGLRLAQHYENLHVDIPEFLLPRLRLAARLTFWRAVDAPWYGVGNATPAEPRPAPEGTASAYYYVGQTISGSTLLRIKTHSEIDLAVYQRARYESPDPAPGSKLAEDLASGALLGGRAAFLETVAVGLVLDTRDSEVMPRSGVFYTAGVGGTLGTAEGVRFGEASISLAHYASFGRAIVFANRILGTMKAGNVPFYELQQGDVFAPKYLVGGNKGVRGVRLGRYAGLGKAVVNTELRMTPLPRFKVLGSNLLVGITTFFDAGRVWSDYAIDPSTDGRTLGLRWGAGGGPFLQWNGVHVFRVEAAYSPDASGRPLSFYFDASFFF